MEMTEEEMSIDRLTISQPGIHQSVVTSGKAKSDWFKVPYIRRQHHLFQKHSQVPPNLLLLFSHYKNNRGKKL